MGQILSISQVILQTFVRYLQLIRFSHTLFALPFALLSAAMAIKENLGQTNPVQPRAVDFIGLLLCMVFARSAAMAFNRLADKDIDTRNPRTADRHLPAGLLSPRSVLLFITLCSIGFIASTLLFLPNVLPVVASVPVLVFLFGYSFAKRWTVAAHFWLGTALMLAPLAAWIAFRPALWPIPRPPILLGLGVLFWSAGFDLIYACQDAAHDKEAGLYSVPGRFGIPFAFRLAALCHVLSIVFFFGVSFVYEPFSPLFQIAVAVVALLLGAEHFIAAPRAGEALDLFRVNIAFFQMNALVSLGLLTVGLLDLLLF